MVTPQGQGVLFTAVGIRETRDLKTVTRPLDRHTRYLKTVDPRQH